MSVIRTFNCVRTVCSIPANTLLGIENEDAFAVDASRRILVVADGITRDCRNGKPAYIGLNRPFASASTIISYPRPSPARMAAEISVSTVKEVLSESSDIGREAIQRAAMATNESLRKLGSKLGLTTDNCDYLSRDFPGCVLSVAVLERRDERNVVIWGFIGDCSVAVFDAAGRIVGNKQTPTEGLSRHKPRVARLVEMQVGLECSQKPNWDNPVLRRIVRSRFRNNPSEELSYGALTGESWEKIEPYFKTGLWEIESGQVIATYTDGVGEILLDSRNVSHVANYLKNRDFDGLDGFLKGQVKSEGTLCLLTVE